MAYYHGDVKKSDWRGCMRCGRQVNVLSPKCPPLLAISIAEQRGFQCIVCGQITCFDCSDNRFRCTCGGNAWIARVYRAQWLLNDPERRYASAGIKMIAGGSFASPP
jgi:hypothetical protein